MSKNKNVNIGTIRRDDIFLIGLNRCCIFNIVESNCQLDVTTIVPTNNPFFSILRLMTFNVEFALQMISLPLFLLVYPRASYVTSTTSSFVPANQEE